MPHGAASGFTSLRRLDVEESRLHSPHCIPQQSRQNDESLSTTAIDLGEGRIVGRAKRNSSPIDELYETLLEAPRWAGPVLALIFYCGLRWLIPWAFTPSSSDDAMAKTMWTILAGFASKAAPWSAVAVLIVWLFALLGKSSNRKRLDRQTGIESIRVLSWFDFERLLAEAFRRQGYSVDCVGGNGPDGGVDLRLERTGELVLVQCKQWLSWSVGVKVVRELYGIVAAENATRGIVVTSGKFTHDAITFARTVSLTLIDGEELVALIAELRAMPTLAESVYTQPARAEPVRAEPTVPQCPTCGEAMKLRTAKQGSRPGSQFWGCSKYPGCRGTRPLSPDRVGGAGSR